MKKLRDDKVGELIRENIRSRDPMADAEVVPNIVNRTNAFAVAQVPDVLDLEFPPVQLGDKIIPMSKFKGTELQQKGQLRHHGVHRELDKMASRG